MAVVEARIGGAKPLHVADEKTGDDQQQTAHGHLCSQEYRAGAALTWSQAGEAKRRLQPEDQRG